MNCEFCGSENVDVVHEWCETTISCRDCKKVAVKEELFFGDDSNLIEMLNMFDAAELDELLSEDFEEAIQLLSKPSTQKNVDTLVEDIEKMMNENKNNWMAIDIYMRKYNVQDSLYEWSTGLADKKSTRGN